VPSLINTKNGEHSDCNLLTNAHRFKTQMSFRAGGFVWFKIEKALVFQLWKIFPLYFYL
jgi:hypothetical protein